MKLRIPSWGQRTSGLAGPADERFELRTMRAAGQHLWIMMPTTLLCLILLPAGLGLTGCAVSPPPPLPTTFPVRYTAEVDWPKCYTLEELKDLPVKELSHPESGMDGIVMFKGDETNSVQARTWREFDRYSDEGYLPSAMTDLRLSQWFIEKRGFIPFLEQARPSKVSFVGNLPMNRRLLSTLPIELGPQVSDEEAELAQKATAAGKTWLDFYPKTRIRTSTKTMLHIQAAGFDVWLRVMAYGDFNGDGLEDVLLWVSHQATKGTLDYSFTAVLTRQAADKVLQRVALPDDQNK